MEAHALAAELHASRSIDIVQLGHPAFAGQATCLVMAICQLGLGLGDVDQWIGMNHARRRQDQPH